MPIRLRIILIACIAVLSLTAAFFIEYQEFSEEIEYLRWEIDTIHDARILSELAHALQKERGLSASYLVDYHRTTHKSLLAQRERSDDLIQQWKSQIHFSAVRTKIEVLSPGHLATIRAEIDRFGISWDSVRAFYSVRIHDLLDTMVAITKAGGKRSVSYHIESISQLAVARENMGLIRATLSRIYINHFASKEEILELSRYYGAFSENLRLFLRDIDTSEREIFQEKFFNETYHQVIKQIENELVFDFNRFRGESLTAWWDHSTVVIDQLKATEEHYFDIAVTERNQWMAEKRAFLFHYIIFGFIITALVGLLSFFAIARILQALSILLQTLDCVIKNEDFGLRIHKGLSGEFDRIAHSLNLLLEYTDSILKEKDNLASIDLLTGVMNRRSFLKHAECEVKRDDRYQTGVSIIFCDIDHFKKINDTFGHDVGDQVLKAFARLLQQSSRSSDVLCRWGGEEFIILASNTHEEEAIKFAEILRSKVEMLQIPPVKKFSCSFGVATRSAKQESLDVIMKKADERLYQAKNRGRNRVVGSSADTLLTHQE